MSFALVGCGSPAGDPDALLGEPWEAAGLARAIPPQAGDLTVGAAVEGHTATFTVTGMDPSTSVTLLMSTSGSAAGSCGVTVCVDLDPQVRLLGTANTDPNGDAWIEVVLPVDTAGKVLHVQAVGTAGGLSAVTPVLQTTITENALPTKPVIAIDPAVVRTDVDVTVDILTPSTDADGHPVTYVTTWTSNTGVVHVGDVLGFEQHSRDEVWTVRVVPSDGAEEGPRAAAEFTVGNSAPEILSVSVDPLHPAPADTITCAYTFHDPDGDADTSAVRWYVEGVDAGVGAVFPGVASAGQLLDCQVEPFDGTTQGASVKSSIRVPSNVLVVLIDDAGVDKIGAYGMASEIPPTPVIDALAAGGVLFREAYAQPVCSPTRSSILTGRHPFRTGVGDGVHATADFAMAESEVFIPQMLDAGTGAAYEHAYIGKWHLSTTDDDYVDHARSRGGFGWYSGTISGVGVASPTSDALVQTHFDWERVENGVVTRSTQYVDSSHVDDALGRIAAMGEPWFLMVGLINAHKPFHEPPVDLYAGPPLGSDLYRQQYHWMVEAVDTEVGRLLASMDPAVLARTTVIVMGDNGSKGDIVAPEFDPLRQKRTMYQGGVHVPLIVNGPVVRDPGREVDALVHAVDLFPTIADLASATVDPNIVIDGVSMLPYLLSPDQPPLRTTVYSELFTPVGFGPYDYYEKMIRDERYKLIRYDFGDEFYDMLNVDIEGVDLLTLGALTAEQQAAYDALVAALPN